MALKHELVADTLHRAAKGQKWYQKYANTINATLAALAGAVAALAGQWTATGEFPGLTAVLVFIAPFLTAIATRFTKNGITPSVERKLLAQADEDDREAATYGRHSAPALPVYSGPTSAGE